MAQESRVPVVLVAGEKIARYGFPDGHPFGPDRHDAFMRELRSEELDGRVRQLEPRLATREELETFHTPAYVDLVIERSGTAFGARSSGASTPVASNSGVFDTVGLLFPPGEYLECLAGFQLCGPSGLVLPTLHDDVAVLRVELEQPCDPPGALRGDQRRAAAAERIEHEPAARARVADCPLDEPDRLHRWVQIVAARPVDEPDVALVAGALPSLPGFLIPSEASAAQWERLATPREVLPISIADLPRRRMLLIGAIREDREPPILWSADLDSDGPWVPHRTRGALAYRVDVMNRRAEVVDQWRLIRFNANGLESDLDLVFNGEISTAVNEQSQGLGQVNQAITHLDQMTQQNSALVEQSSAATMSLKDQAGRLSVAIGSFKTGSFKLAG